MQGFPAAISATAVEFFGAHSLRIAAPKYTKVYEVEVASQSQVFDDLADVMAGC